MKKFFSFVCALVLVLSATAAPLKMDRAAIEAMKANLPKVERPSFLNAQPIANFGTTPRRAVEGGTVVGGITFAEATYFQGTWYMYALNANNDVVAQFTFTNNKDNQIAGTYGTNSHDGSVMAIVALGDTVDLKGSFHIDYAQEGANYPKYHVYAADLLDSLFRTFDFDFTVEVLAYDYQKWYYSYNYSQYCGVYVDCDYMIELVDAPYIVTGDTVRLTINDLWYRDLMETAGWWEMMGYSADSAYYVRLSNLSDDARTVAEGTYTYEQMDPDYTYLYIDSIETTVKFRDGVVILSQNPDGSHHIVDTLLAKDGTVYIMNLNSTVVVPSTMNFSFQVTDSSVIVTPSESDPWTSYFISQENLEQTWNYNIDSMAQVVYNYNGDNYNVTGEKEYTFSLLLENNIMGEVIMVVWGSNGGVTTAADSIRFVVPVPVSENVITLSYTKDTVHVSTTNDDPYFFYIETKADYESSQPDYTQASLNTEVDEWIAYLEDYASYFTVNGDINVNVADFLGEGATTGDYVALAAPIYGTIRNGDASYLLFHYVKVVSEFMLTDNLNWGTAYVYAWDANGGEPYGAWPGTLVTETAINDMQQTQFVIGVPDGAVGIVVNNGNGTQTVNITDFNYDGYWMDGTQDGQGHYNVIGYGEHSTAVQNVEATGKVVKALRNGQLIIRKNGVEFDVIGARLK